MAFGKQCLISPTQGNYNMLMKNQEIERVIEKPLEYVLVRKYFSNSSI